MAIEFILRQKMKKIFNYIITFILMIIVAWGALYIVSYIPKVLIKNNARISADQLKSEKEQYYIKSYDKKIFLFPNISLNYAL